MRFGLRQACTWRRRLLAVGLAALCSGVAVEAAFRVHLYRELERLPISALRVLDAPILRLDPALGFRYIPSTAAHYLVLDETNRVIHENVLRINAAGHVSPREDALEKPEGEYRIAVIGDSFTACHYNEVPWPLLLEDLLNAESDRTAVAGPSRFKVINFGMFATGFEQWPAVYEHEVLRYRPDLVLVAFIENDLWRGFKWADSVRPDPGAPYALVLLSESLPVALSNPAALMAQKIVLSRRDAADPDRRRLILAAAMERKRAALPWWSPHSELLAVGLHSASIPAPGPLRPRLPARNKSRARWGLEARLDEVAAGMRALSVRQDLLLVELPTQSELVPAQESSLALRLESRGLQAVSLRDRLLERKASEDADSWFIANNGHLTQGGSQVYAEAVYAALAPRLPPLDPERSGSR